MWLCRILRRDRSLGPPVRSKGYLSSSFFIYRPLVSLLLPSQGRASPLLLYGILALSCISPRVKQLVSRGLLGSVSNKSFDCMPCQFGKQTALPFNNNVSHALSPFDLIHSDVWGPFPITTQGGSCYFVIFWMIFQIYLDLSLQKSF